MNTEQRALENFERWARRNEWAKKFAKVKTRELISGRTDDNEAERSVREGSAVRR